MAIPKKVTQRLISVFGRYSKVLEVAFNRDVNEADTVTIVKDILSDVFGFDKYSEITSEFSIRGTYVDLATTVDGKVQYLVEVKAIGLSLKENHLRQAVQYGATHGIPWVVLTNGREWEIYRVMFEQPVREELVAKFCWPETNPKKADDQDRLWLLCREGMQKAAIEDFHALVQVINRFTVAAIICSEPVVNVIRKELRRLADNAKVESDTIQELLLEVLKRDVLEGDDATAANKRLAKSARAASKKAAMEKADCATTPVAVMASGNSSTEV